MSEHQIKDLIYFDFAKAASIYSQFSDGLVESTSIEKDYINDRKVDAKIRIPGITEIGGSLNYSNATSVIESKLLHHDLLNKVEELLTAHGLVSNLNTIVDTKESSPETIRSAIGNIPYILTNGHSVIEDYVHIKSIISVFNQLIEFIGRCSIEPIKKSPEFVKLQNNISEKRKEVKGISDRNKKSLAQTQLDTLENMLNAITTPKISSVDEYLIDGVKLFIDTFMPTRINFRIYPFEMCPSFQVICNLKHDCFVDQDLQHLLYGYGSYDVSPENSITLN